MSTEDGTYLLAHQEGLDLTKYLNRETVDRVRTLTPATAHAPARTTTKRAPARSPRGRAIRIGPRVEEVDALLPEALVEDARRMADVYPYLFVLENSLRQVITRVLKASAGKDWWARCAPKEVKRRVEERRGREDRQPWHGKRGAHEITYSDFGDLKRIIESNWKKFDALFPSVSWIGQRLDDLEPLRNVVAHSNALGKRDLNRMELYFHDYIALLNDRADRVPSA